jgi:hypothetical protein
VIRQEELAEDVRSLARFLGVLVAEASHLELPVPTSIEFLLCELQAWEKQLTSSGSPPSQHQPASVHVPPA